MAPLFYVYDPVRKGQPVSVLRGLPGRGAAAGGIGLLTEANRSEMEAEHRPVDLDKVV